MTTFAVTVNGRITMELKARPGGRSLSDELQARLDLLDGDQRFAFWLWRLPVGVRLDQVDLDVWPTELIQCAGGVDGRFTCEIRSIDTAGQVRHDVVGRLTSKAESTRSEPIRWADNTTLVQPNEVLNRSDIGNLFLRYLDSGALANGYSVRPLAT